MFIAFLVASLVGVHGSHQNLSEWAKSHDHNVVPMITSMLHTEVLPSLTLGQKGVIEASGPLQNLEGKDPDYIAKYSGILERKVRAMFNSMAMTLRMTGRNPKLQDLSRVLSEAAKNGYEKLTSPRGTPLDIAEYMKETVVPKAELERQLDHAKRELVTKRREQGEIKAILNNMMLTQEQMLKDAKETSFWRPTAKAKRAQEWLADPMVSKTSKKQQLAIGENANKIRNLEENVAELEMKIRNAISR